MPGMADHYVPGEEESAGVNHGNQVIHSEVFSPSGEENLFQIDGFHGDHVSKWDIMTGKDSTKSPVLENIKNSDYLQQEIAGNAQCNNVDSQSRIHHSDGDNIRGKYSELNTGIQENVVTNNVQPGQEVNNASQNEVDVDTCPGNDSEMEEVRRSTRARVMNHVREFRPQPWSSIVVKVFYVT